jgi:hypothetical protein
MQSGRLVFALFTAAAMVSSMNLPAEAKSHPKAPEVYSAVESNAGPAAQATAQASVHASVRAPKATLARVEVAAPARPVAQAAGIAAPTAPLTPAAPAFDAVPAAQTDALSMRLVLVDALIRRHGRAYDYRALTVKKLQELLAQLDHANPTL